MQAADQDVADGRGKWSLADLKYIRLHLFYRLMRPFAAGTRRRRMARFCSLMNVRDGMRVLDLGGQPDIWDTVAPKLKITILNLDGIARTDHSTHHEITYVVGDACRVTAYGPGDFDMVFSNSVIEHVGPAANRAAFAAEARRLGPAYWVQTPAIHFPVEAHTGMPFWWFYPEAMRQRILDRWRRQGLPDWTDMVEGTDIVSRRELETLFPDGTVMTERVMGIPKSYALYKPAAPAA